MSTDPRSGLLPSAVHSGGKPSPQQPAANGQLERSLERHELAAVARWSWTELGIVLDLLTEKFVRLEAIQGLRWRAHCAMCSLTSYVDLHDRNHIAHDPICIIGRMLRERNAFEKLFRQVLASLLSQGERRLQPDTREMAAAAVEQPSPGLRIFEAVPEVAGDDIDFVTRIGTQLDAVAAAGAGVPADGSSSVGWRKVAAR